MADFTYMPTWVDVLEPKYPNIITQSENYKKDYQNLDPDPLERFRLKFLGLSDADAKSIYDHYKGEKGGYSSFAWKNAYIPDYIISHLALGTNDLTGHWVEGSFRQTPNAYSWDIEIEFEKAVT